MAEPKFAIAVFFTIDPQHTAAFRERVLQQAKDSLEKEPDCHQFDVLQDEANPDQIFLYETYTNAEAFDFHTTTPHFKDFLETVTPWIVSKDLHRLVLA